jgi:hypothetical protein
MDTNGYDDDEPRSKKKKSRAFFVEDETDVEVNPVR